ncbi:MAG: DUF6931 family protein, partial [Planctomycetaceae bacterium]
VEGAGGVHPRRESAGSQATAGPQPDAKSAPASAKTAAELCRRIDLSEEARSQLGDGLSPLDFLDALTGDEFFPDAVRFLAHVLPKREAVAWGCRCVGKVLAGRLPDHQAAALVAARQWTEDPTESHRRAAHAAAESLGFDGITALVAMAAFWSGGSITPPDAPVVPPADGLTGQGLTGALLMAAYATTPADAPAHFHAFLADGRGVLQKTAPR